MAILIVALKDIEWSDECTCRLKGTTGRTQKEPEGERGKKKKMETASLLARDGSDKTVDDYFKGMPVFPKTISGRLQPKTSFGGARGMAMITPTVNQSYETPAVEV